MMSLLLLYGRNVTYDDETVEIYSKVWMKRLFEKLYSAIILERCAKTLDDYELNDFHQLWTPRTIMLEVSRDS